jgi:polyhydroxyalkanoate synthase
VTDSGLTPIDDAPQHGPRPLPLFLDMLRSETAASPARRAKALAGLKAYQTADRGAARPRPAAVQRIGRAALRDYGGAGRPVVFVPSLINPPFILDLADDRSLLRWLAGQGVRPMLVDWGNPSPGERDLDIAGHVETMLLPMLRALAEPPVLVGYCLGGTMALAAAGAAPAAGLALLAAPWRFSGFGEAARGEIAALWAAAEPACDALGLVPMEVLQSGFWRLDPRRTIAKYEAFAGLDPASEAARSFVALEDWANAGAPLTYAAGAELFGFFARDRPGRGGWTVAGRTVDPAALPCPAVDFVSTSDRIVPAASAARLADTRTLGAGHVGMIVGSRAKRQLWEPLAQWIAGLR